MNKLLLSSLILLFYVSIQAQDVNSISIFPPNPDDVVDVKVIVNTSMNTSDCWITTSSVTSNGANHSIIGAHCSGLLQTVCTRQDTYSLGQLNAGVHTASYDMFFGTLSSGQTQCTSFIFGDSASTTFTVTPSGGSLPAEVHPQGEHDMCQGDSMYLHTDPFGQATYKWFLNGTPIYTGPNHYIYAMDSGVYNVRIYANNDSGTSAGVLIKAHSAPTDSLEQIGNTVYTDYNSNAYQWYRLGAGAIPGADSTSIEVVTDGEYYVSLISQLGCEGFSDTLYVELIEAAIDPPGPSEGCLGDSIELTALPTGSQYNYQWFRDGISIAGAFQSTYTPFLSGNYTVKVGISQSVDTSDAHVSTVFPGPSPSISFDGANLFSTPHSSYQWHLTGSGAISGATDSLFTPTETGLYYVVVTDSMGCEGKSAGYAITTVGQDDKSASKIQVFQNKDRLVVMNLNGSVNSEIRVLDLSGRIIYSAQVSNPEMKIYCGNWAPGIYFVRLSNAQDQARKVIIQ